MAEQVSEKAPETATPGVVEAAAGSPPSPQPEYSDSASSSSAAGPSEVDDREEKQRRKKKRDASKAAVRRRVQKFAGAETVEELEQMLLAEVAPKDGKPALTVVQGGGTSSPATTAAAAPALQLVPTAPAKPIWPSKDQVEPWKEPLQQILTACNTIAALKLPAPYPLADDEVKKLSEAMAPVAAKHLPDALNSPEAALIAVAIAIALPRVMYLVMQSGPKSQVEQPPPPGKAAA